MKIRGSLETQKNQGPRAVWSPKGTTDNKTRCSAPNITFLRYQSGAAHAHAAFTSTHADADAGARLIRSMGNDSVVAGTGIRGKDGRYTSSETRDGKSGRLT